MKQRPDYKWVILGTCFVMLFVCLGFCSSNKSIYLAAITDALGIKRSLFSINDSFRFAAIAITNLFFGPLVARFGVRKMTAFGFLMLIASMLAYAAADNIFVFYVGGTLLGVGLAFTSTTMAGSIIRQWFHKDIGTYTGIVFAANGIGGTVAVQLVSPLINEPGNPFGYRSAYLLVAGVLVISGIVVVALLREAPAGTAAAKKKSRVSWEGISYETARSQPYFYFTAVIIFLTGFILQGISGVYAAHMQDAGLEAEFITAVVSVFSLSMTVSKLLVGWLYDRFGLRVITILCQGATTVAFLLMAFLGNSPSGKVQALIFAALFALAMPLETLVIPLIVGDLFGAASYDKILGIYAAMNYVGYAVGCPAVNLGYDILGSYTQIFLFLGALMIPICVLMQMAIGRAQKQKNLV